MPTISASSLTHVAQAVDAIINALRHNTHVQVLYMHGFSKGMRDEQLSNLVHVCCAIPFAGRSSPPCLFFFLPSRLAGAQVTIFGCVGVEPWRVRQHELRRMVPSSSLHNATLL